MTKTTVDIASASRSPPCHAESCGRSAAVGSAVVALAGAPNAGKSTLFNAITGARRSVGNWPGTTVEVGRGAWRLSDREVELVDLPGAYSLEPASPDEELTRALLVDPVTSSADAVVVTVDAAHLSRSLYLVAQLREQPRRIVLAVTMVDVAARRGVSIDGAALSAVTGAPVVLVDPRRRCGTAALATAVQDCLASPVPPARRVGVAPDADDLDLADERYRWVADAMDAPGSDILGTSPPLSDRVDRWVTSSVVGPVVFLAAMWAVLEITTTAAAPLQDILNGLFAGPVRSGVTAVLDAAGLAHTWVGGFVLNGLVAGVGMLLTFLPLMALMFLQLAVLEDSGYLARAAVVTDRLMRSIGLPGRAFLPLVVGFGCNVPAIAATRVLPNARHRLLTALLVPLTSCSARLTVYVLVASTFFPRRAGTVVFCMYVVSVVLVVLVGLLLRSTLWRALGGDALVLDLPPYQRPTLRLTAVATWVRLKGFLRTASGIIVVAVCAVWLLQSIPVTGHGRFGQVPVTDSAYAAAARVVAPVFGPAGFGEWRTSSALIVGFVAKEAVVTSWAQTYAAALPRDVHSSGGLGAGLRGDFERSSRGHPSAAACAFLLFFLAYTPCVATLAAQHREMGLRWTAFGVALQLTTAWFLATAVFQLGRLVS